MRKGLDSTGIPPRALSREEVVELLRYMHSRAIPGPDIVNTAMLYNCPDLADQELLKASMGGNVENKVKILRLAFDHGRLEVVDKILSAFKTKLPIAYQEIADDFTQKALYGWQTDEKKIRDAYLILKLLEKGVDPNLQPNMNGHPRRPVLQAAIYVQNEALAIALIHAGTQLDFKISEKAIADQYIALKRRKHTSADLEDNEYVLAIATSEAARHPFFKGFEVGLIGRYLTFQGQDHSFIDTIMEPLAELEFDYLSYAVQVSLYSVVDALIAKKMPISSAAIRMAIINSDIPMLTKLVKAGGSLAHFPGAVQRAIATENLPLLTALSKLGAILTTEDILFFAEIGVRESNPQIFHILLKMNTHLSGEELKTCLQTLTLGIARLDVLRKFILAGICTVEEIPILFPDIRDWWHFDVFIEDFKTEDSTAAKMIEKASRKIIDEDEEEEAKIIPFGGPKPKIIPLREVKSEIIDLFTQAADLSPATFCDFVLDICSEEKTPFNSAQLKLFFQIVYSIDVLPRKEEEEVNDAIGLYLYARGDDLAILFLEKVQNVSTNNNEGGLVYSKAYRKLLDLPVPVSADRETVAGINTQVLEPWRFELADLKLKILKAMLDDPEWSHDTKAFYEKCIEPVEKKSLRKKLSAYVGFVLEKEATSSNGYCAILMSRAQYFHDRGEKKTASYDYRLFKEAEEALVKTSRPSHKRSNSVPAAFK